MALLIGLVLFITIACCKKPARTYPINYILLLIFTLCWGYMVAGTCSWYDPTYVFVAAALTAVSVVGLTIFSATCMSDKLFTVCLMAAVCLLFCLFPAMLMMWIFPTYWLYCLICGGCVILSSIYIVIDTQMIMKDLSTDEYIFGALILYIDIINMFLWLLSLFAGGGGAD